MDQIRRRSVETRPEIEETLEHITDMSAKELEKQQKSINVGIKEVEKSIGYVNEVLRQNEIYELKATYEGVITDLKGLYARMMEVKTALADSHDSKVLEEEEMRREESLKYLEVQRSYQRVFSALEGLFPEFGSAGSRMEAYGFIKDPNTSAPINDPSPSGANPVIGQNRMKKDNTLDPGVAELYASIQEAGSAAYADGTLISPEAK